ncbi:MAG: hypothetical protein HYU86_12650 [Chloroflexi bacterium]|nr:hypothetical protein [Chloroflexota bacterium]
MEHKNYWYGLLTDTLVDLSREEVGMKLAPGLALSWKALENDPKTWEFKLRQGVKFHNGEDFDADTVVFNMERNQKPELKLNLMIYLKEVTAKAVDKYTVRLTWPEPYPLAPARLQQLAIVPRKYIQEKGDEIMNTAPIGTGPYKFVKWAKDEYVEMAWAGSHWRLKTPPAKTIIQTVVPDISARVAVLKTEAADIIWGVPEDQVAELTKDPIVGIYNATGVSVPTFGISQMKEGPLRDKRVRLALNLAIDREKIVNTLFGGTYKVAAETVIPVAFGYDPTLKPYPYDHNKAKALLAEAGYPNGFETVIDMGKVSDSRYKESTQAIAEYLRQIGVKTTIRPQEAHPSWGDWGRDQRAANKGPEGIYLMGYCDCTLDASDTLVYYSKWDPKAGSGGLSYIEDDKLFKMIDESNVTTNVEKREKLLQQIMNYIHEQAYGIPLWHISHLWGYNKKKIKTLHCRSSNGFTWDLEVA